MKLFADMPCRCASPSLGSRIRDTIRNGSGHLFGEVVPATRRRRRWDWHTGDDMSHTNTRNRPRPNQNADEPTAGIAACERHIASMGEQIQSLIQQWKAIVGAADDDDDGRLCLIVKRSSLQVALRSSMSAFEATYRTDEYLFWFGLQPGFGTSRLEAELDSGVLLRLASMQLNVRLINHLLRLGYCPDCWEIGKVVTAIDHDAHAVRSILRISYHH